MSSGDREATGNLARKVTVCSACLRATCWHGHFMCERSGGAGTVDKTVGELLELNREHPSYWREGFGQ
jgi:hypothetical protein